MKLIFKLGSYFFISLVLSQSVSADMAEDLAYLNGVNTIKMDHGGPISRDVNELRKQGMDNWDICVNLLLHSQYVEKKYQNHGRKWVEGCSIYVDQIKAY